MSLYQVDRVPLRGPLSGRAGGPGIAPQPQRPPRPRRWRGAAVAPSGGALPWCHERPPQPFSLVGLFSASARPPGPAKLGGPGPGGHVRRRSSCPLRRAGAGGAQVRATPPLRSKRGRQLAAAPEGRRPNRRKDLPRSGKSLRLAARAAVAREPLICGIAARSAGPPWALSRPLRPLRPGLRPQTSLPTRAKSGGAPAPCRGGARQSRAP